MAGPRIALFIPCFVEALAPATAGNLRRLCDRLALDWYQPREQTCCGQPSFNAGFWREAARCAAKFLTDFADADAVVAPSASCVAMVRRYVELAALSSEQRAAAIEIGRRTHEICSYLVDVLRIVDVGASYHGAVAYHDACHALRGLGIREQPRALLRHVRGLDLRELPGGPQCCGFGGTFSVKYPEISASMADARLAALEATGTATLVSTDLSCLQHLGGRAERRGQPFIGFHVVDLLAAQGPV
ncbi:MAG: (Fe-S)-binding protein [Deltaproteobacteria bacterium]|nr:(Fe-S)-binding protein [Deltaproteobacteria bacterium]